MWITKLLTSPLHIGIFTSSFGVVLYLLLNWSYFTAVFVDPGSPLDRRRTVVTKNGYSHLPVNEPTSLPPSNYTSFTVKADGRMRFCKKCQAAKPDRAHHCSTCGRCVLKMDHHCPWLATCVGLKNYKAFLLFLIYISFFCWLCFVVSGSWVWSNVLSGRRYTKNVMPVNYILLAVISGIFGLVLTGFTLWHIWLASSGMTTIEKLEKTRYLTPVRQAMQRQIQRQQNKQQTSIGDQLREIHANTLPSITRPEEGEDATSESPAHQSLRETYESTELRREHERYESYLDDIYSERLPNAFDLGRWRNLQYIFGEKPLYWCLPVCNSLGDGWQWEPNPNWVTAQSQMMREREQQQHQQQQQYGYYHGQGQPPQSSTLASRSTTPHGRARYTISHNSSEEGTSISSSSNHHSSLPQPETAMLGRSPSIYSDGDATRLSDLNYSNMMNHNVNNDVNTANTKGNAKDNRISATNDVMNRPSSIISQPHHRADLPVNWNDIPSDMLDSNSGANAANLRRGNGRSKSGSDNKGHLDSDTNANEVSTQNLTGTPRHQRPRNRNDDGWDEWAP